MQNSTVIFVINLTRDQERWRKISAALESAGLNFVRIRAVDARRKISLVRRLIDREFFSTTLGRALSPGECCCSLSHISALKRLLRMKLSHAVILEDDAQFESNFASLIADDLPRFLRRCDIVKLEGIEYDYTSKSGPILARGANNNLMIPMRPTLGTAAYGITAAGARRLISAVSGLSEPFDHLMCYYDRHGIAYGEVRPFAVRQAPVGSGLDSERNVLNEKATAQGGNSGLASRLWRGATRIAIVTRVLGASLIQNAFSAK